MKNCLHDESSSYNGIQKVSKHDTRWVLTCSSCSSKGIDSKLFQFSKFEKIIQNAEKELEILIQNIVTTFSQYKSIVFSTLTKIEQLSSNPNSTITLNLLQQKIMENNFQNLQLGLFEGISKLFGEDVNINIPKIVPSNRHQRPVSIQLADVFSQKEKTIVKPPIPLEPIKFIMLPQKYPQLRIS